MSTTTDPAGDARGSAGAATLDMGLEVIVLPVSDVDRAKEFYGRLGWRLDADRSGGNFRLVQFTPPGSGCSVQFGTGITAGTPGSVQDLHLAVSDIAAVRDQLDPATRPAPMPREPPVMMATLPVMTAVPGAVRRSSRRDQLLAAVDVVGRAGERRVGHDVHGEGGDIGRLDDAPDGQRRAKLAAALVQAVAEQRRGQRGVDEPGGDQVVGAASTAGLAIRAGSAAAAAAMSDRPGPRWRPLRGPGMVEHAARVVERGTDLDAVAGQLGPGGLDVAPVQSLADALGTPPGGTPAPRPARAAGTRRQAEPLGGHAQPRRNITRVLADPQIRQVGPTIPTSAQVGWAVPPAGLSTGPVSRQ